MRIWSSKILIFPRIDGKMRARTSTPFFGCFKSSNVNAVSVFVPYEKAKQLACVVINIV